jgi:hypothetical protein
MIGKERRGTQMNADIEDALSTLVGMLDCVIHGQNRFVNMFDIVEEAFSWLHFRGIYDAFLTIIRANDWFVMGSVLVDDVEERNMSVLLSREDDWIECQNADGSSFNLDVEEMVHDLMAGFSTFVCQEE